VVGSSAAGLATAEALRRQGYQGTLTLLGGEPHLPYDRPPLSKQVLAGTWEPDRTQLRPTAALDALNAEFIQDDRATGLDLPTRTIRTASGRALHAEAIVVATGVAPRRLSGQDELSGVHVLRTLADASALRTDLLTCRRLVVVGEGVLGSEIAATARGMGVQVTMAGPQTAPMATQFGPAMASLLGNLHLERGVVLRLGTGVDGLVGRDGRVSGVRLASGEVLPADVVVVAIGSIPATAWLADSGLEIQNGLVCDSRCRAGDGIYGVGDVARWQHQTLDVLMRLENRTNATEQAAAVAANILGAELPYCPVPYFWTDQFDAKIQAHGVLPAGAEMTVVEGDAAARRFVALFHRGGRVTGVIGWNMPKQTRQHRQEVVDALAPLAPAHA
jgi:NADPH-dependent 2,4-dienoyl-CoA reductase/sulfur reductase-like enzyme